MASPEPVTDDRLVSEEGVPDAGLLVVPGFLLPLAPPNLYYSGDSSIAMAKPICVPGLIPSLTITS